MAKSSKNAPTMSAEEAKWQAENDMRTLIAANEIRADQKRYSAACKCAMEMAKTAKAVADKK